MRSSRHGQRGRANHDRTKPNRGTRVESSDTGTDSDISERYRRIYQVVRSIPRGRVLTYGQVAEVAGMPGAARVVGAAMRASLPALRLPWQRVVGKRRRGIAQVSIHDPVGAAVQRQLLEAEGVTFSDSGGISLVAYGMTATE